MSGNRPHFPESEFTSAHLSTMPPGTESEEIDIITQFNNNAAITNEGAGKLSGLLNYLAEFNDTISINDGRGRRVRVLGVEDVAGGDVEPIEDWWGLEVETIDGEIIVTIGKGMCERPVEFEYDKEEPMPHAWGHITEKDRATEETEVNGGKYKIDKTTKFYVKAYVTPVMRPLTDDITSISYNFKSFNIITSTEDAQPPDTASEKYKLLGHLVIPEEEGEGGHCPEIDMEASYWRTNHVFNWSYYSFIQAKDDKDRSGVHLDLICNEHQYSVLNYDGTSGGMGDGANIMQYVGEGSPTTHCWRWGLYIGAFAKGVATPDIKDVNGNILRDANGTKVEPIKQTVDNWSKVGNSTSNLDTIELAVCVSGSPVLKKFVIEK